MTDPNKPLLEMTLSELDATFDDLERELEEMYEKHKDRD